LEKHHPIKKTIIRGNNSKPKLIWQYKTNTNSLKNKKHEKVYQKNQTLFHSENLENNHPIKKSRITGNNSKPKLI